MKVLSLFSGIGAFEKALKVSGIPFELVGFSEIDKYAVKSYCAIHGAPETLNLGDITEIDEKALPKDIDLITYGFPCQDISLAGKQKGLFNDDGSQTRSGLFFEALRIIEETQPKVAIAENVKNLVGKKFNAQFQIVLASLEAAGYNNYWKVLNAKDYGIPQNRERVFIVSIRKDIDTGSFTFPEAFPLTLRLKDMLDDEVDEKYYLSDKMKEYLVAITQKKQKKGNANVYVPSDVEGVSKTITTKEGSRVKDNFIQEPAVMQIGNCHPTKTRDNPNQGRIYNTEGLSPCLTQMGGGNLQPFVTEEPKPIKAGFFKYPNSDKAHQSNTFYHSEGVSPTLDTCTGGNRQVKVLVEPVIVEDFYKNRDERIYEGTAPTLRGERSGLKVAEPVCLNSKGGRAGVEGLQPSLQDRVYDSEAISTAVTTSFMPSFTQGLRIRKLTPKECFRLMGFTDEDFAKVEAVNSDTQLYKQAGNSIVVDVLVHIFAKLLSKKSIDFPDHIMYNNK